MTHTPSRQQLVDHLISMRICGDVATPRQSTLGNARRCADGEPGFTFGMRFRREWTYSDVVNLMAERVGISADLTHVVGTDYIDPGLCVDRLEAMGQRLARAARDRERVLVATGHPAGMVAVHLEIAATLRRAGCTLLEPAPGASYPDVDRMRHLRHVAGVAMVSNGAGLAHTHSPRPMEIMLDALGDDTPELVIADHGFAGAAGQAGVDSVGFADCNDPALFVGEAEGSISVAVPLDDNVLPHMYAPLSAYLVARIPGR